MTRILLLALLALTPLLANAATPFPALEVAPPGQTEPRFHFSPSLASNADPIVITVAGRALGKKDREHRVDLQKYWLQQNIPDSYTFVVRGLVECPSRKRGEFGGCDEYRFKDAAGVEHAYTFDVGNWP
jgi:hypothetical protein